MPRASCSRDRGNTKVTDLDCHLPDIVAGDARAFGRWVAGAELRIRLSLSRFAGGVDVEAVVQETLLRVWHVAPRLTPDGKPDMLVRFAIRVARNAAISELRRYGRQVPVGPAPEARGEAVRAIEPDPRLREHIAMCREKLPNKPALALAQRLSSPSLADDVLAERVGMVKNTFLQNVTRARKMLASCLERVGVALEEVMR